MKLKIVFLLSSLLFLLNTYSQNSALQDSAYRLSKLKKYSESYSTYRKAEISEQLDLMSYYRLARVCSFLSKKDSAIYYLKKAIINGWLNERSINSDSAFFELKSHPNWESVSTEIYEKKCKIYGRNSAYMKPLSRDQMLEDFDFLVNILKTLNPQIPIREKLKMPDPLAQVDSLRNSIFSIKNNQEFGELIFKVLGNMQDGHTNIAFFGNVNSQNGKLPVGVESIDAQKTTNIYFNTEIEFSRALRFNPELTYINGKYYNLCEFRQNKETVKEGAELLKCNGIPINQFVQTIADKRKLLHWDFKFGHYYSTTFFRNYSFIENSKLDFEFLNGKETKTVKLNMFEPVEMDVKKIADISHVSYFKQKKTLYIKQTSMNNDSLFIQEILKYKGQEIDIVVYDIRDNFGGSDFAWMEVLNTVFPTKFNHTITVACRENKKVYDYLDSKLYNDKHIENIGNKTFYVNTQKEILSPNKENLGYKGKMYVLANNQVFSAGGSMLSVAKSNENIISIGIPTGRFLGRGIEPVYFTLPNSKIIFKMPIVHDFDFSHDLTDLMHNNLEFTISPTLDDYIMMYKEKFKLSEEDYLFTRDTFFKKVFELNKK